jgi:hypothetical protein
MKKTLGQVNYEAWCASFHPSDDSKGQFEFQHLRVRDAEEASAQAVLAAAGVDAELVRAIRASLAYWPAGVKSPLTDQLSRAAVRIEAALRGEMME